MKALFYLLSLLFLGSTNADAIEPQISAGRYQNMALDSDGAVYMWRANAVAPHFQVKSLWQPQDAPTKVTGLPPAMGIAAGTDRFVEILTMDGAVYEWGYGPIQNQKAKDAHPFWGVCELLNIGSHPGDGPCGMSGADFDAAFFNGKPTRVEGLPPVAAVTANSIEVLALTNSGDVYCWGVDAPLQRVPGLSNIIAISMGIDHGMALRKDGAVVTWGKRALGIPPAPPQIDEHSLCDQPKSYVAFTDAIGIYATDTRSYAWRKDGSLWAWGGLPFISRKTEPRWQPEQVTSIPALQDVVVGAKHVIARTADNQVYAWENDERKPSKRGALTPISATPIPLKLPATTAVSTYDQSLILTRGGYVCAWEGRPDAAPHAVMLADGNTLLNLYADRKGKSVGTSQPCASEN